MSIVTTAHWVNKRLGHTVFSPELESQERIVTDPASPHGAFMRVQSAVTSKDGDRQVTMAIGIGSEDAIALRMTQEAGAKHMVLEFRNVGLGLHHSRSATQTLAAIDIAAEAMVQIKQGQIPGFSRMKRRLGAVIGFDESPKALAPAYAAYYTLSRRS